MQPGKLGKASSFRIRYEKAEYTHLAFELARIRLVRWFGYRSQL
jgi:hypothetical protein